MTETAKVLNVGHTQAILLPAAFHVDTCEVWISQNKATGEITLKPKDTEADVTRRQQEIEMLLKMIENDSPDASTMKTTTTKPAL